MQRYIITTDYDSSIKGSPNTVYRIVSFPRGTKPGYDGFIFYTTHGKPFTHKAWPCGVSGGFCRQDQIVCKLRTPNQIYAIRERLWQRRCRIGYKLAHLAHPMTGGNPHLVHNWGNTEAKAAWENIHKRYNRGVALCTKNYNLSYHVEHVINNEAPCWCELCNK